ERESERERERERERDGRLALRARIIASSNQLKKYSHPVFSAFSAVLRRKITLSAERGTLCTAFPEVLSITILLNTQHLIYEKK
ncbi:MAG: hypothetical protein LBF85_06205, partial [Tannerella sp.]|nr:hypothetical protein [Tannerella sp.]